MFVLIKNKITGDYKTIKRKDIEDFKNLYDFFKKDPKLPEGVTPSFNFDIIEDRNEIKKILDDKFTSKNRGEEYDENLPSVTKIISLVPMSINTDKFLLRWQNNTDISEQDKDKSIILSRGTWCHKILELFVLNKDDRNKEKPLITHLLKVKDNKKASKKILKQIDSKILSDIRKYINIAYKDEEIIAKIPNINEIKEELEFLATKCLPEFIKNELIFSDTVYSEIFLSIENTIQGSVDSVVYKGGVFSIVDYKTTSSVVKKTGKPKFKQNSSECLAIYARQLYLYNKLLKHNKMTHLFNDENPKYEIIQIHLISNKYKKFDISEGLVASQGKIVEKVLNWYWDIRKGNFDKLEQEFNEENNKTDDYNIMLTL